MSTWLELLSADEQPMLFIIISMVATLLVSIAPGSAMAAAAAIATLVRRGRHGTAGPAPWDPCGPPPIWTSTSTPTRLAMKRRAGPRTSVSIAPH